MIEKILKEINRLKNELDGYSALEALDYIESYINTLQEESSNDLQEEIDKIWKTCNPIDEGMGVETANIHIEQFDDVAHHFAKWQEKKILGIAEAFYQQGRYEQEQEMMKDAVELTITNTSFIPLPKLDIKAGDKAKIIIIKT